MNKKFGLLGKTLKHSYSKLIHEKLGNYQYELYEREPDELEAFVRSDICGFNVTIPYKREIMRFIDVPDRKAEAIGAVNTVVKKDGKLYGYNTDFDGMQFMLRRAGIDLNRKKVIIFGNGGTSQTAQAVAKHSGASKVVVVSRKGEINYDNVAVHGDADVLINTTPVGMFPSPYELSANLEKFDRLSGVADVIYNPSLTMLLYTARQKGIPCTNGLPMLVAQAKSAAEKFFFTSIADSETERIISQIERETRNIILVGMPGSGKTSVGLELAQRLNREFIDTDDEIVNKENRDIPNIFKENGENYFRAAEKSLIREVGKLSGKIIATGGGVVKDISNLYPLIQNGKIFYIARALDKLAIENRPLSMSGNLEEIYRERKAMYELFADVTVDNNGDLTETVNTILTDL